MVLEVRDLHAESGVRAAAADVRAGEIGLAGLVRSDGPSWRVPSSAPTASCQALFAWPAGLSLADQSARWTASTASRLVPENRKTEGLALMRSVQDNVLWPV
jgi:ribose transport system ATP-binding protein